MAQLQSDAASHSFSAQATDLHSIATMTFAGLTGRIARLGFLSSGIGRLFGSNFQNLGSHLVGLGFEAAAFEGMNRSFSPLPSSASFAQNWTHHFINFSTFRFVGFLGGHSPAAIQHLTQSFAMVAGHQVAGLFGLEEVSHESFAAQMLKASVSVVQIQMGSSLAHFISGGIIQSVERKLEARMSVSENSSSFNSQTVPTFRTESIEDQALAHLARIESLPTPQAQIREKIKMEGRAVLPTENPPSAYALVVRSLDFDHLRNLLPEIPAGHIRLYRGQEPKLAATEDLAIANSDVQAAFVFRNAHKLALSSPVNERLKNALRPYDIRPTRDFSSMWATAHKYGSAVGGRLFYIDITVTEFEGLTQRDAGVLIGYGDALPLATEFWNRIVEIVHEPLILHPRPELASFTQTQVHLPWSYDAATYSRLFEEAWDQGKDFPTQFTLRELGAELPEGAFTASHVIVYSGGEHTYWTVNRQGILNTWKSGEKIYISPTENQLGREVRLGDVQLVAAGEYLHLVDEERGVFVSVKVREMPCRPGVAERFWNQHESEVESRIDAFLQHFPDPEDPAAARERLRVMERSFCTSLCDRLERISTQHGLGDKPVILFDVDETILKRISKKDFIRPSLALLLSFLRAEFPQLKFGIASSRLSNWEQMEEGCFSQADWREVEGFFERDLLFTLSEDPRNTYEGRPTPLNDASSWNESRRDRFYNEDFAALVDNYLAHAQVFEAAIRQRVTSEAKAQGRELMDWERDEPFDLEEARESLYSSLGVSVEQSLRDLPLETLLFKLSSRLRDQNQFEGAETIAPIEHPHENLRKSFQAEIPSKAEFEAKKRENQSLSSIDDNDSAEDFRTFLSAQTGEGDYSFNLTKLSAGRVLLDQNRASCCLVVDAAFRHELFALFDAAGNTEPNPYTLLGIRRYQHRLWMINSGEEGCFSVY